MFFVFQGLTLDIDRGNLLRLGKKLTTEFFGTFQIGKVEQFNPKNAGGIDCAHTFFNVLFHILRMGLLDFS